MSAKTSLETIEECLMYNEFHSYNEAFEWLVGSLISQERPDKSLTYEQVEVTFKENDNGEIVIETQWEDQNGKKIFKSTGHYHHQVPRR